MFLGIGRHHIPAAITAAVTLLGVTCSSAADLSAANFKAISNALSFVEGMPRSSVIQVGVVFGSDNKAAEQAARQLEATPSSLESIFKATPIADRELGREPRHLNLLLVMPDASGRFVSDFARREKVISIGLDPSCIDEGSCVLMIQSQGRIHVVLQTRLADAVNAKFSSVFTMMVERK